MSDSRRNFLKKSAILGLTGIASSVLSNEKLIQLENFENNFPQDGTPFTLPALPYAYDAMEPFIDKQTMEIHYSKHHKAYVDKLNGADLSKVNLKISDIQKCKDVNAETPAIIRNNLGGHVNHSLFWTLLKHNQAGEHGEFSGKLSAEIRKSFGSLDNFVKEFSDKAVKIFGSGWCWLIVDKNKKLKITTTPNQDNPWMPVASDQGTPILALDVWEHAYYLKYQNKRADYIAAWWFVVNWEKAEELYISAMK